MTHRMKRNRVFGLALMTPAIPMLIDAADASVEPGGVHDPTPVWHDDAVGTVREHVAPAGSFEAAKEDLRRALAGMTVAQLNALRAERLGQSRRMTFGAGQGASVKPKICTKYTPVTCVKMPDWRTRNITCPNFP